MAKSTKHKEPAKKSKSFASPLDEVVWTAYKEPKFFKTLEEAKDDLAELRAAVEARKIKNVSDNELSKLQESLNRSIIEITAIDLMKMLHQFTTPKNLSLKGNDQWRVW